MPQVQVIQPIQQQPKRLRVAAYARVSSDSTDQLNSLSVQVDYYTHLIQENPNWDFAGIYTDEGITGTSTKHREQFNRLMDDCRAGLIDRVLVKSASRFARNTADALASVREMKSLGVTVVFEKENFYTETANGEMILSMICAVAQEESLSISKNLKWSMQCGCCDERLYWHPKTNQWFCRRCGMWAKPLRAEETSAAIAEKLCWLRQNPEIIHNPEGQANVQSVEGALLDREIWQALTNAEPDVDVLVAKILHRAELEYEFCSAGDADPATMQIRKACAEYKPTDGFSHTFYKEVVSKVILYRDTHIEFKLQNGQIV